jgi:hypothetical protein
MTKRFFTLLSCLLIGWMSQAQQHAYAPIVDITQNGKLTPLVTIKHNLDKSDFSYYFMSGNPSVWKQFQRTVRAFSADCSRPINGIIYQSSNATNTLEQIATENFEYNAYNQLTKYNMTGIRPERQEFYYNANGQIDSIHFFNRFGNDSCVLDTRFIYNNQNQLINVRELDISTNLNQLKTVYLTYDDAGRLSRYWGEKTIGSRSFKFTDLKYTYNSRSQVMTVSGLQESFLINANPDTIREVYTYNDASQLVKAQYYRNELGIEKLMITKDIGDYNSMNSPKLVTNSQLYGLASRTVYTYAGGIKKPIEELYQYFQSNKYVDGSRYTNIYCGQTTASKDIPSLDFTVYPNPAFEQISVNLGSQTVNWADIQIINVAGQTVQNIQKHNTDTPLSISSLSNGLYVLKIKMADKTGTKTFSVMR